MGCDNSGWFQRTFAEKLQSGGGIKRGCDGSEWLEIFLPHSLQEGGKGGDSGRCRSTVVRGFAVTRSRSVIRGETTAGCLVIVAP